MLISAIMPTANRPELAREAARYFLGQQCSFETRLVILDDGCKPILESLPHDPRIRYFYHTEVQALGRKRNRLCELAGPAEIIIHWDDDDWSDPARIETQARSLLASGKQVTGFHSAFFYECRQDPGATGRAYRWEYQGTKPYALGASLCYFASWWKANRFPDQKSLGEDHAFVQRAKDLRALDSMDSAELLVARRHAQSTSRHGLGSKAFPEVDVSELPERFLTAETQRTQR